MNKNIFKLLGLSLFIGNFSIYSSVATNNIEVPNRYQTLEGEYITIDNSTEGELHEIEIFGNTVQDENNLEDIQSVGDLYVDEDGNPILDTQGREQYKVDIVAKSKNLFNPKTIELNKSIDSNGNISESNTLFISDFIEVEKGKDYTISGRSANFVGFYDINKNFIINKNTQSFKIENELSNSKYIRFHSFLTDDIDTIQVELGTQATSYSSFAKNVKAILLPTQLQKIGDIADRLYWDSEKGRYVIEKRISETIKVNSSNRWEEHTMADDLSGSNKYLVVMVNDISYGSNDFKYNSFAPVIKEFYTDFRNYDGECINPIYVGFRIKILKTRLETPDLNGFKKWLDLNNGFSVERYSGSSTIIETNITSKLKIPNYSGKTHICVESKNGVNPNLKVTVDRLSQIAKNAIEEAKINPTTENIALARMYINMLSESTNKDQLHEELNEIFSSDITFDKKTATANLDIYIKSENMLLMNLSTNSITFSDYSGVDEMEQENAVEISINSSLPYQLNAYLLDEMYNSDRTKKIDMDRLNIKDNTDTEYKEFTSVNNKLILKENCDSGNNKNHNIDLKLKGGNAYESDIYKTVIKFEVEQK